MQLLVDQQQQITSYASFGSLTGGIDYTGQIPDEFTVDFQPGRYLLKQNLIVINPDYTAPTEAPTMPTTEQQLLMQQEKDIIQLKQLAMDQEEKIATLSKGSAK